MACKPKMSVREVGNLQDSGQYNLNILLLVNTNVTYYITAWDPLNKFFNFIDNHNKK